MDGENIAEADNSAKTAADEQIEDRVQQELSHFEIIDDEEQSESEESDNSESEEDTQEESNDDEENTHQDQQSQEDESDDKSDDQPENNSQKESDDQNVDDIQEEAPRVSRIDRRLKNVLIARAEENGEEIDEDVLINSIQGLSAKEKTQALKELTKSRSVDKRDVEALAEQKAQEILMQQEAEEAERQELKQQETWHDKVSDALDVYPQLNMDHKDFDKNLADQLELTLFDGTDAEGNPIPRYGVDVEKTIELIVGKQVAQKDQQRRNETRSNSRKAMSDAIDGAQTKKTSSKKRTWKDMEKIQDENPALFEKMAINGELPEDDDDM